MHIIKQLQCNSRGCNFMKYPDKENNGGTHCCKLCQIAGKRKHGPKCKKHKIENATCDRSTCWYLKNPDVLNNHGTHCCKGCKEGRADFKEGRKHGMLCTKNRDYRPAPAERKEKEVEKLEEFHGVDFPHFDLTTFPCGSLREARSIAAQKIGKHKIVFAAFCSLRQKIFIRKRFPKNHPNAKKVVVNPHVTLFYLTGLFNLGAKCNRKTCYFMKSPDQDHGFCCRLCMATGNHGPLCALFDLGTKCNRKTCNFMKNTDQDHGFCCLLCKTAGNCGPSCKKVVMGAVIREEREKCERPGCRFKKHPDRKNHGGTHCCGYCKIGKGHGKLCEQKPVGKVVVQERQCERPGCHFLKNPDTKNNGGTHCCLGCKKVGQHGGKCAKKRVGAVMQDLATGFV